MHWRNDARCVRHHNDCDCLRADLALILRPAALRRKAAASRRNWEPRLEPPPSGAAVRHDRSTP